MKWTIVVKKECVLTLVHIMISMLPDTDPNDKKINAINELG